MKEEEEEMLPCPFCGCEDIIVSGFTQPPLGFVGYRATCTNCNAASAIYTIQAIARDAWNRRM
jgi:Lar family restriction alleviation protein